MGAGKSTIRGARMQAGDPGKNDGRVQGLSVGRVRLPHGSPSFFS